MAYFINATLSCCNENDDNDYASLDAEKSDDLMYCTSTEDIADDIIKILFTSEKAGKNLERQVNSRIHAEGWTENLARKILERLEEVIKKGAPMGQAMKEAAEKATTVAEDFIKEHKLLVEVLGAFVAVGVLALLLPWVLEVLGFGELGPIADSFAALWQRTYMGNVPKGSWFSFFQRLGMVWKKPIML
ncbi:hypothetical protein F5884DRAFT_187657 [Xylogone sp. PMI_703]|nr:hypothetical protein F5884DRAFT_187657 [Xylogone sp. PMI_703]